MLCFITRHLRFGHDLATADVLLEPAYLSSIYQNNDGIVAQYVRFHVENHAAGQGYQFSLYGCAAQVIEGQCSFRFAHHIYV